MTTTPPKSRATEQDVPYGVRVAAAWSWRLLAVAGAVLVVLLVAARLTLVVGAFAAGLLLAAVLQPIARRLITAGMNRLLAAWVVLIAFVATMLAVGWFVGRAVTGELGDLRDSVVQGIEDVREWLVTGPFELGEGQIDDAVSSLTEWIQGGDSTIVTQGLLTAATTAGHVVAGTLLALFVLFFLLYDGRTVWSWVLRLLPRAVQGPVDEAGARAWTTLVAYVRSIVVVAFVDAVLIAIALLVLGVPLVPALAALTFLGAFVPVVGATLAGTAAVLVALVDRGPAVAIIVAAAVLVIQWFDSDVLQPIIVGRAVHLHPLAVGLAVTTGAILAGIGGAVVAVPLMAAANSALTHLSRIRSTAAPSEVDSSPEHPAR